jgi:DNA-3-methyladenine glycosylase
VKKLPLSFYRQDDVVEIARALIGKYFFSQIDGNFCGGIIAETEAYAGITDRASHAYNSRLTKRTQTMYLPGGISYVYFTYGMHHLFNVVTAEKEVPHAVLIRGIIPTEGIEIQQTRRKMPSGGKQLTNGPAKVCQALGINLKHNAVSLQGNVLWIAEDGFVPHQKQVIAAPRVGVDYAGEDAKLPYRFILNHPDYSPVKNRNKQA